MGIRAPLVLLGILLLASVTGHANHGSPENLLPVSKGVYRLPYPAGTDVFVTNDHVRHNPHNRLDMSGVNPNQNVVAAADGWIEYIQDAFDLTCPSDPNGNLMPCNGYNGPSSTCCVRGSPGCNCRNNYVWMRHPNGEWSKYTHVQFNSVPNNLSVGDFVTAGTVIGVEGDVGFASGAHVHMEVGVPDFVDLTTLPPSDPNYDPLGISPATCNVCGFPNVADGDGDNISDDDPFLNDTGANRQNRIPVFCQLGFVQQLTNYTAAACDGVCNQDVQHVGGNVADDVIFYRQGSGAVTSDMTVDAGAGAGIKATTQLKLLPGFSAEAGSFFVGAIGACDSPGT